MRGRYDGLPLLRLVEYYLLDAIGELSPDYRERLDALTPRLA